MQIESIRNCRRRISKIILVLISKMDYIDGIKIKKTEVYDEKI